MSYKEIILVSLFFIIATLLLQFNFLELWIYKREYFYKEFWFKSITAHLVHFNLKHWFFNIINLIAIFIIFRKVWSIKKIFIIFLLSAICITIFLYIFSPNIKFYYGMSGVLYALAVYGGLKYFKIDKVVAIVVLSYIFLKLMFHDFINKITLVESALKDFNIVTEVHFYGTICGVLFFALETIKFSKSSYTNDLC